MPKSLSPWFPVRAVPAKLEPFIILPMLLQFNKKIEISQISHISYLPTVFYFAELVFLFELSLSVLALALCSWLLGSCVLAGLLQGLGFFLLVFLFVLDCGRCGAVGYAVVVRGPCILGVFCFAVGLVRGGGIGGFGRGRLGIGGFGWGWVVGVRIVGCARVCFLGGLVVRG